MTLRKISDRDMWHCHFLKTICDIGHPPSRAAIRGKPGVDLVESVLWVTQSQCGELIVTVACDKGTQSERWVVDAAHLLQVGGRWHGGVRTPQLSSHATGHPSYNRLLSILLWMDQAVYTLQHTTGLQGSVHITPVLSWCHSGLTCSTLRREPRNGSA